MKNFLLCLVLLSEVIAVVDCWSIKPFRATTTNINNGGMVEDGSRRAILQKWMAIAAAVSATTESLTQKPLVVWAAPETESLYKRQTDKFAYSIQLPSEFKESQKPVKTHLDEINFSSESIKGYQFGITIDPVRINGLKEFGTPEQVAARVVTAEVNRDGIFEVTLLQDPYETSDGAYLLEYLSVGKRGNKHYYNKIFIANNKLYVLTAQIKQDDFASKEEELKQSVQSFAV